MSNKVVLIRPQNIYHYNNYPPLNLICLGSQLKKAGYEVKITNCALEKTPFKVIEREIKGALFVGISLLTSEVADAYSIVEFIKENSTVPIVAGGVHCTLFPEQTAMCEYVDYVIAGEGEEHILQAAEMIKNSKESDGKIFHKQLLDIEMLPMPDYSLVDDIEQFISSYLTDKLAEYVKKPMRWLPYESSRGCPSKCTFCINVVTDNQHYRKKSASKVLSEIEYIVNKYQLTHLKIIDDNFFVDVNRVRAICEGILHKGMNITWDGECRCDYFNDRMLSDEMLELLKRSGLVQLTLGIESGSSHTLEIMKKNITTAQAEFAVEKCDKFGIIARSSFMLEVPGETLSDIKQTIRFVNKLRKFPGFTCGVGTFRPYPKCELTRKLLEDGVLTEPNDLKGWTNKDIIAMYTSVEYKRPWQVEGKYSENAAYYLNMESAVRLGNYQINSKVCRIKNNIFMFFAKIRNKILFYNLPLDKELYKKFLTNFYKRKEEKEKQFK